MKVCFVGAGAIGSSLGGVLTGGGLDVWLLDKWAEHVEAMNRSGLRIRDDGGERLVTVRAAMDPRTVGVADLVVVLVKSFKTREAIQQAQGLLGPKTMVLSLQNGLGNEDTLIEVVGRERVIGGRTHAAGVLLGPGHVATGHKGKVTYVGELDGTESERVQRVAQEFTRAGLETAASANIVGMMWDKLAINVATGAWCGVTRLPFGGLRELPELKACAVEAVREAVAVARAAGVTLSLTDPEAIWTKAHTGLPAELKPSILQDLEKGTPTEIDFINGSVVRVGEKVGVPTPVNRTLVAAIKGIELGQKRRGPGR